jgi:hypothetical protein
MTVKELIQALQGHEQKEVWVSTDCHGCLRPADQVIIEAERIIVDESGRTYEETEGKTGE